MDQGAAMQGGGLGESGLTDRWPQPGAGTHAREMCRVGARQWVRGQGTAGVQGAGCCEQGEAGRASTAVLAGRRVVGVDGRSVGGFGVPGAGAGETWFFSIKMTASHCWISGSSYLFWCHCRSA